MVHWPAFWSHFTTAGVGLVFGRSRLEVNALTSKVTYRWGLLFVPFGSKRVRFFAFDQVILEKETYVRNRRQYYYLVVRLSGESQDIEVKKWLEFDYEKAKKQAEELSRVCGLPVCDRTGDQEVPDRPAGWQRVE